MMANNPIKPFVMSMQKAGVYLGDRSESTVRDLLAAGKIQAKRDGKRIFPITASMDAYLESLPPADDVKPSHPQRKTK
jgi:hypothetical protein